jgi:hypothetical protein
MTHILITPVELDHQPRPFDHDPSNFGEGKRTYSASIADAMLY